ncbi:hypothetical protein R6Q59_020477, partial [Mikania micrantha]
TCVQQAGVALRMLTEKNDNFDLLLIDCDMRDVDTITFLRLTKNMGIISMVMCPDTNDRFLLEVLENGGFRVVKTPLTHDAVMHIRQDVISARFRNLERFKTFGKSERFEPESESGEGRRQDYRAARKKVKKRDIRDASDDRLFRGVPIKKRVCVEWRPQLHAIFLRAIEEVGEGNCFPKAILEAMGVPGLTRLQVASHLQKCRLDVLKVLQKKGIPCSSKNLAKEVDLRMLSSISSVETHVENHDQIGTNIDGTFSSNQGRLDVNNQSMTDFSLINFENLEEVYSVPTDCNHNNLTPDEVPDDFFDFLDGVHQIPSLACMEVSVSGLNSNYVSAMPTQGTSELNHHIQRQ